MMNITNNSLLKRWLRWLLLVALAVVNVFCLFGLCMAQAYARCHPSMGEALVSGAIVTGNAALWLSPVVLVLYWCPVSLLLKKGIMLLWGACILLTLCGMAGIR